MNACARPNRNSRDPLPLGERELWSAADVAQVWGVARSTVCDWNRTELIPSPVHIGRGIVGWRRRELLDWLDARCPPRHDWRWRPNLPAKLDDLIRVRSEEIGQLERDLAGLKERAAAGEQFVSVSRRPGP